jgi:hypothetical protein
MKNNDMVATRKLYLAYSLTAMNNWRYAKEFWCGEES